MKTVTIADPAELADWLDKEQPGRYGHTPVYTKNGWGVTHYPATGGEVWVMGRDSVELLGKLREVIAEEDPIERLRREAAALNLQLVPKP